MRRKVRDKNAQSCSRLTGLLPRGHKDNQKHPEQFVFSQRLHQLFQPFPWDTEFLLYSHNKLY